MSQCTRMTLQQKTTKIYLKLHVVTTNIFFKETLLEKAFNLAKLIFEKVTKLDSLIMYRKE